MTTPSSPKLPFQAFSYFLENSTYEMQKDAIRAYARDYARASIQVLEAQVSELKLQLATGPLYSTRLKAKRYDYLREQYWSDGHLCVVLDPRKSVVLGSDCPSGDRLDSIVDAAMVAKETKA